MDFDWRSAALGVHLAQAALAWRITGRAGFPRAQALMFAVPFLGCVMAWGWAASDWPDQMRKPRTPEG